MTKLNLDRLAASLAAEKKRLEAERSRLADRSGVAAADGGEMVDYDVNHPADMGSELFEREKDIALAENVASLLAQVNGALSKLQAGTYGRCDVCGDAISDARLKALPYATMCISCQSRLEG